MTPEEATGLTAATGPLLLKDPEDSNRIPGSQINLARRHARGFRTPLALERNTPSVGALHPRCQRLHLRAECSTVCRRNLRSPMEGRALDSSHKTPRAARRHREGRDESLQEDGLLRAIGGRRRHQRPPGLLQPGDDSMACHHLGCPADQSASGPARWRTHPRIRRRRPRQ